MFIKKILIVMKRIFIFFLLLSLGCSAQKNEFLNTATKFSDATSFHITSNGFIYVTDKGNDEVIQLDTLGNIIKDIGGFGWNSSQFDEPVDVFADPLSVYVTDKNNHRIQRFDRNLNFISLLTTRERENPDEKFGYPLGCVVSNQGDLYVLDSENKRVLKFDLFGNFQMNFGGIDAGAFRLKAPTSLAINSSGNIYVADENSIILFDQFGNGINKISLPDRIKSLKIIFDQLVIVTENSILYSDLSKDASGNSATVIFSKNDQLREIVCGMFFNNKIYLLTPKSISVFTLQPD